VAPEETCGTAGGVLQPGVKECVQKRFVSVDIAHGSSGPWDISTLLAACWDLLGGCLR